MALDLDPKKQRYLEKAYELVGGASAEDFLDFLSLRDLSDGATARFYDAFEGRRAELIHDLQDDATDVERASASVTNAMLRRLMRLVADIKDRSDDAIPTLKQFAAGEFDDYFKPGSTHEARELVRNLMTLSARNDEHARQQLKLFYDAETGAYGELCSVLLDAAGREPVAGIGSVHSFAIIVSALYDGLGMLARIEGVDAARTILTDALIPLIVGLTKPVGKTSLTESEMLYGKADSSGALAPPR